MDTETKWLLCEDILRISFATMATLKAKVQVLKRFHKSPINLGLILLTLIMLNAFMMLSREYCDVISEH